MKRTNSRLRHTDFVPLEQNCLSNNSDFSVTRRFQDEPLISLRRPTAREITLSNTSQPKQIFCLNHVDLIIVFLKTTQRLQTNVFDGVFNQQNILLVNAWHNDLRPIVANRLLDHAAFVAYGSHWAVIQAHGRWECDDFTNTDGYEISSGDFWKIFVR